MPTPMTTRKAIAVAIAQLSAQALRDDLNNEVLQEFLRAIKKLRQLIKVVYGSKS